MSISSAPIDGSQEEDKNTDRIVNGSTWAAIWHMSWPMMLQMFIISGASFVDITVAKDLGSNTQAAIGICNQIWFLMLMMTVALSSGTLALISRFWGARDYVSAKEAARQSLIFAITFGIASTFLGLLAAKPMLALAGGSAAVQLEGWRYLSIDLLSQLPFTIVWVAHSIFRAIGNSREPMVVWCAMAVVIVSLDIFLCLGPPHLGVAGIGWAWLIGGILGLVLNIYLLAQSELKEALDLRGAYKNGIKKEWLWRILKVGVPTCIQDVAWVLGNFALFWIFSFTPNPTVCQASWTIGFRVEEMLFTLPLHAIAASIGTIVGQNLGANKTERASQSGWQASHIGLLMTVPGSLALYLFAGQIATLMSRDLPVITCTTSFLQYLSFSMPFVACWFILFGAMAGAGYTRWPMWVGLICLTLVRLPLAYILATYTSMGTSGIWLAISISSTIIGLLAIWKFKEGGWKNQTV
jgi:putative MATE family efflux protein